MTDIVASLRRKHTLYVTSVAGILLTMLIGLTIGLTFVSADITADNILDDVIESFQSDERPDSIGASRCFAFVLSGQTAYYSPIYQNDVDFYEEKINDIIDNAVNKAEGNFACGGYRFTVKTAERNNYTVYAVYDRTADVIRTRSVIFVLLILFFVTMVFVTIFAYAFSAKTTQPLKDAFNLQKDLIANASHELKTPLAIISANLAVMNSEKESTVQDNAKWLESISGQVDRMNQLVKSMLELSRLEQSTIKTELVDFGSIVESACLEVEAVAFEKGATLITNLQKDLFVQGDKASLERLVFILLDNALKYCGDSGKVGCRLGTAGKRIHLEVMNTGTTISEEDAEHVFDRFYRSDGARQNPDNKSFGLGLAIAKATTEAHGGTIACHGVDNKGSVFEVYLPLKRKK